MAIDWTVTGTALSGWGSVLSAAAVLWATHRATGTLAEWKQKRVNEREEAHAQECLVAAYQVVDAFQAVRSPLLHAFELEHAQAKLSNDRRWTNLTEQQQRQHEQGQVYIDRLDHFSDRFDRLAECGPLARALFGHEVEAALGELGRQHWVLTVEIQSYIHDRGIDRDLDMKLRNNLCDWKCEGEGDISKAILKSVATIEAKLLPVLRG